ncbi:MAG TPA: hypothetical protein VHT29_06175 [Solirubrobacteraceae bacterium]|nr:hypothetical protein [Solirubrobacteraceae bacterium]
MTDAHLPPRIAPLEPPYSPDVATSLESWMPPESPLEPLRLFRTLVIHDRLASRMRAVGAGILGAGALIEPRLREVVIHRTCALTGAHYEWGVHARAFGRPLGFSDAQLHSTVHGSAGDECWDAEQACVFRLADELHTSNDISDDLWRALGARFSEREILELIVTVGWYHTIAYVCNGVRLQDEEWAEPRPG